MRLVGEQHHQTVDPDTQPSGRGQPVFQRQQVIVVDGVCLLVPGGAGGGLLLEPLSLVIGVVELTEGVGIFRSGDHQFEPVGQTWIGGAATSQR